MDQNITVRLLAVTQQYRHEMMGAARSTEGLVATMKHSESAGVRALGNVAGAAKVAGAALAGGIAVGAAASIAAFANFDAKMNESLAIMGDLSEGTRQAMADVAREVGTTTKFSAAEAAEAYYFLASAGLSAKASMEALPTVARFAQAGMFDMALATEFLADAQSALGLTVRDDAVANMQNMTRVSDVLTKANILANASVQQFSEAITNKAGAAVKLLGKDVEEGVAVLAAFADQGVKGAEAGERLNITLRDLQTASLKNREEWDRLGVSVYDASGDMRNVADIIGDLEGALAGASDEQVRLTLMQLGFQDRSVAAVMSLLGTSDAIRDYEAALRDASGITEEVADKQMQTLSQQLGLLKDKLVDVGIGFGEELAPKVEEMLPSLERMIESLGRFATSIAPLVAGALKGIAGGIEAISIVGTKIVGLWDESARAAGHLGVVALKVDEWMGAGASAGTAYANAIAFLSDKSALTVDALDKLARQTEVDAVSMANATKATLDHARATGDDNSQVALLTQSLIGQATALVESGEATVDQIEATYGAGVAYEVLDLQRRRAAQAAQEHAGATGESTGALEGEEEQLGETTGQVLSLEEALRRASDAHQSLADTMRAMVDPAFAAVRAVQALRTAEENSRRVAAESGRTSEEFAAAQLDLVKATLEAQGALDAFSAFGIDQQLEVIARTLGTSKEEARLLLETLDLLDGAQVATVIDVTYRTTVTGPVPRGVPTVETPGGTVRLGGPTPYQHGGPIAAGQAAWVGEAGPELFVPDRAGTVVPHHLVAQAAGGDTLTVVVNNPTVRDLNRDLQVGLLQIQTARLVEVV